jgi:hypothetical protein
MPAAISKSRLGLLLFADLSQGIALSKVSLLLESTADVQAIFRSQDADREK